LELNVTPPELVGELDEQLEWLQKLLATDSPFCHRIDIDVRIIILGLDRVERLSKMKSGQQFRNNGISRTDNNNNEKPLWNSLLGLCG